MGMLNVMMDYVRHVMDTRRYGDPQRTVCTLPAPTT